jgi:sterol desaturase/sphingolipid hydroxylase (fatty acid hydroxylase superfamily)
MEWASGIPTTAFIRMFEDPSNRWFALYLLSAFLMAFFVYRWQARSDPELREEGFLPFAFPAHIYKHRSARVDYFYFVVNKLFFGVLFAELAIWSQVSSSAVATVLASFSTSPMLSDAGALSTAATAIAFLLCVDFGLWLGHFLLHRVPVLWEFHKVHHSAEVLTPFSAGRVHPVDDLLTYSSAGIFGGAALGVCTHLFGSAPVMLSAVQLSFIFFTFYFLGFHLRHSHVWLPYTGWLGRILISPAHHQVHHSSERRHWDKNMGFIFAFWDWSFGTLYVPSKRQETFRLGIGGEEKEFNSVAKLYLLPFIKVLSRLKHGAAPISERKTT